MAFLRMLWDGLNAWVDMFSRIDPGIQAAIDRERQRAIINTFRERMTPAELAEFQLWIMEVWSTLNAIDFKELEDN